LNNFISPLKIPLYIDMQLYTLNPFILRTNILIAGFIRTISRREGYRSTGGHKITASAIAKELGILKENDLTLTGSRFDSLEDGNLRIRLKGFRFMPGFTLSIN